MAQPPRGQRHDRTALVLYGSETGNSQDVAEELGRVVERLHFVTRVKEMDLVEIRDLLKYTVVIFAVSTTGQGEFPSNAKKFWKSLLRKRLPPGCLSHVSFTTFGLGDSSYPRFNYSARKLHKRLAQLGAKEVYAPGEGDEQHDEGIDGTFLSWSFELRRSLLSTFPLPEGLEPISAEVLLPPKYELEILDDDDNNNNNNTPLREAILSAACSISSSTRHEGLDLSFQSAILTEANPPALEQSDDEKAAKELENIDRITQSSTLNPSTPAMPADPFLSVEPLACPQVREAHPDTATPVDLEITSLETVPIAGDTGIRLFRNKRVTPHDHWQDVRELTFLAPSNLVYEPGDTMSIYPQNFPRDVQAMIDLQGWGEIADKRLRFVAGHPDYFMAKDLLEFIPEALRSRAPPYSTLRFILTNNLDITAIPKRFFFQAIAPYTADDTHKERLLEFANPSFTDEFYDYTSRPRRSILEVLQDFPTVKLPWKLVCSFFPVIRARKYSICSGGALRNHQGSGLQRVQIIVAIVKYRTVLKKIRQGLCSRYLASLPVGKLLWVKLDSNPDFTKLSLHELMLRPIIFIAPGTGIAPCRSLIWERAQQKVDHDTPIGPSYLFFGGRNKDADYFYKDEWGLKALQTTVFTAFSRDQKEKIYVQDAIRREGALVAELLGGEITPLVYVCGSSGNMPKAVRSALVDVMVEHGKREGREGCERYLVAMERQGLYIQETW